MSILLLLLGISSLITLRILWVDQKRKKVGYFTTRHFRDQVKYSELINGEFEHIIIPGEMLAFGTPKFIVYVPSENDWNSNYPYWAKNRMEVIINRIKEELPEPKHEYQHA